MSGFKNSTLSKVEEGEGNVMEMTFPPSNAEAFAGIEPITKLAGTSETNDKDNLEADTATPPEEIHTTSELHIAESNCIFNDAKPMITVTKADTWDKALIEHGDTRAQGEEVNEGIKGDEDESVYA